MKTSLDKIKRPALAAAGCFAAFALSPVAAGEARAWDGESWVYDTSRHVAAKPSAGASETIALASTRKTGASDDRWLDSVFMTFRWSNEIFLKDDRPGLSIIVR